MGFDPTIQRSEFVSIDRIHFLLAKKAADAGIVTGPQNVWLVIDDETAPQEVPSQTTFITVRLPALIQEAGDVFAGGGILDRLMVQGQTRITIWTWSALDTYGRITVAASQVTGKPPRGAALVDKLMDAFWNQDLVDQNEAGGTALTNRPMSFVSYDPPPSGDAGANVWRPWRVVFGVNFTWGRKASETGQ
jgi:hypothetical protein